MTDRNRQHWPPPTSLGFKIWFAFCALLGIGLAAVVVWAIVRLVLHFT